MSEGVRCYRDHLDMRELSFEALLKIGGTECNKIIAPCTLYTKKGIFYLCNRSNRLIYMYDR